MAGKYQRTAVLYGKEERAAAHAARVARLADVSAALRAAVPAFEVRLDRDNAGKETGFLHCMKGGVYASGTLYMDGHASFSIFSVPADRLVAVLRALTGEGTP